LKCFLDLSNDDLSNNNVSNNDSSRSNLERTDSSRRGTRLFAAVALVAAIGWTISAVGELPSWIRNVEANSALQAVFFRMMSLPGGAVLFRRPPRETRPALADLIKTQPANAELYSLRALEDEQQLDSASAETDWKSYVEKSSDKIGAQVALADFYHRRLRPADEIKTLALVANAPPVAAEKLLALGIVGDHLVHGADRE